MLRKNGNWRNLNSTGIFFRKKPRNSKNFAWHAKRKYAGFINSNIFDGKLAIKYTHIYLKDGFGLNDDCLDFLPDNLTYVDEGIRDKILSNTSETKIIVTTSGSGGYGPAPLYFQNYIGNSNTLIHFTGFLFEGSLGRNLRDTPYGDFVKINGLILKSLQM